MASLGNVQIACPECGASLSIAVHAQSNGRSDDGTVQVDVTADKMEIELQALLCGR